ncbi:SPRY domain SOCS box-containing protein [Aphelenchoides avenae]|nr:SPRY domain SOCS box-containing protein [Aphelenchus avenae]
MHLLESMVPDHWTWDVTSASGILRNKPTFIEDDIVILHPDTSFGTCAVRGSKALCQNTVAYWEVASPKIYGTAVMFGIGTVEAGVYVPLCFDCLLGVDDQSYGLSHKGTGQHNGQQETLCGPFPEEHFTTVGMLFDGPARRLQYYLNGCPLPAVFENIVFDERVYYPMVSSTAQGTVLMLKNLRASVPRTMRSLTELSVNAVAKHAGQFGALEHLALPQCLKDAVRQEWRRVAEEHLSTERKQSGTSNVHLPPFLRSMVEHLIKQTRSERSDDKPTRKRKRPFSIANRS